MTALAWIAAGLACTALCIALVNLFTWPRGRSASAADLTRWSFLVPARNEERNIEQCVRSLAAAAPGALEILVYDDQSTDRTPQILEQLAHELPQLRRVSPVPLPSGWVGKPHACARLAEAARGETLVFVDADVTFRSDGADRLAHLLESYRADVVTAVPHQQMPSLAERVVLPLLHLTYVSWLPQFLVYKSRDPRFLAANGQVLACRRSAYDAIGGFGAVRAEVVDDMAFCRLTKRSGRRVVFADGDALADCRMYTTPVDVWRGFSKNLYEGIGATPFALLAVIALYLFAFVAPFAFLVVALTVSPALLLPALVGTVAIVLLRIVMAVRHRQPAITVLLHPISIAAFVALAINSWRWSRSNRVQWSGRTYVARAQRGGAA